MGVRLIKKATEAGQIARPVGNRATPTASQFVQDCRTIYLKGGIKAELSFVQEKHRELFGDYADSKCPPSLVKGRCYYRLVQIEAQAGRFEKELPARLRENMAAVLKMRNDYEGIEYSYVSLMCLVDKTLTSTEMQGGTQMAQEKKAAKVQNKTPNAIEKKRIDVFGHPATAVLRWFGQEGYTPAQTKAAMSALGFEVADGTVNISTMQGKKGQGKIAKLTRDQAAQIKKAIPSVTEIKEARAEARAEAKTQPVKKVAVRAVPA